MVKRWKRRYKARFRRLRLNQHYLRKHLPRLHSILRMLSKMDAFPTAKMVDDMMQDTVEEKGVGKTEEDAKKNRGEEGEEEAYSHSSKPSAKNTIRCGPALAISG